MRPRSTCFRAFLALAVIAQVFALPTSVSSDSLRLKVRGARQETPIPRKAPGGEADAVSIVGETVGETEFRAANEIALAVASGQEGGPNGEIALRVMALPGNGGLRTVRDVLSRQGVDFGIVPSVLLDHAASMPEMANLRDRIAYVAPLYVEEVHLVAGPSIRNVEDLVGRKVSVGEAGGSTEFVSRKVMERLGIEFVEANLRTTSAIDAVRDGSLDAAFVVSGKPVDPLKGLPGDSGLHLVPLPSAKVPDGFVPSVLNADDYPRLVPKDGTVDTYGVQAVLFGYDWPVRSARGRVGQLLVSILMYRLPELQVGSHHPKWREINVAGSIQGWRRHAAMESWLGKTVPRSVAPPGEAEFEAFLVRTGTKVTGENRDALFQDFLRWRNTPVRKQGQ